MAFFKKLPFDPTTHKQCPMCKGSGKLPKNIREQMRKMWPDAKPLSPNTKCTHCKGKGFVKK